MLYPVKLRALRTTTGDYGWPPHQATRRTVHPGGEFIVDNEAAEKLEANGTAERADRTVFNWPDFENAQAAPQFGAPVEKQQPVIVLKPVVRSVVGDENCKTKRRKK